MRIAHVHGGEPAGQVGRERKGIERDAGCIARFASERDFRPVEHGEAHIDGDFRAFHAAHEEPGDGFDHRLACAAFPRQKGRDAAGGIAAGFHLAAIRVENAHARMALRGGFEQDELVAADAEATIGNAFELRLGQRQRRFPRVDHDEIIAQPCILRKGKAAGERTGDTVIERDSEGIDQKWKPRPVEPVGSTDIGPTIHWRYSGFSDKGKTLGPPSLRTGSPDRMQRLLAPLAFASALRPEGGVAAAAILGSRFCSLFHRGRRAKFPVKDGRSRSSRRSRCRTSLWAW